MLRISWCIGKCWRRATHISINNSAILNIPSCISAFHLCTAPEVINCWWIIRKNYYKTRKWKSNQGKQLVSTGWMSLKLFIFLRWKFINQTIKIIRIKRLVVFKTLHVSLMKWSNLVKVKQQPTFWNDSGMHLSRNLLQCSSFSVRSLVGKKTFWNTKGIQNKWGNWNLKVLRPGYSIK